MVQRTKRITAFAAQALFCLSLASLSACSAQTQSPDARDPNRIEHVITSVHPEGERGFTVHLPASYSDNTNQAYPVLYHLAFDREALEWTDETVRALSSSGQIPELIIVSLDHGRSNRDDIRPTVEGVRRPGQAERFLDHIETEVVPVLQAEYRITDDHILSGWSRFGVFATFALAHRPNLFSGYITRSSAGNVPPPILQSLLQDMMSRNPDLSAVFYFAIGTEGNERRRREAFDSLASLIRQNAQPTFRWKSEVIEGAGHSQTFQPGLRNGLLFYFSELKANTTPTPTNGDKR